MRTAPSCTIPFSFFLFIGCAGFFLVASCARNVEFSHEFLFDVPSRQQAGATQEYGLTRMATVTADQIREGLFEAGFAPEDIQSLVVDSAVLEPVLADAALDWIEGFTLFASNDFASACLVHESGPLSGGMAVLTLSGKDLLPFYTTPPFVLAAVFSGKGADDPVRLLVSGRASFRNR